MGGSVTWVKHLFESLEHLAKTALFHCMNCGDCALFDIAYVCPMSQCPKNQRNGACGGSYEGWCEVYPNEKKCVWVQAYERYKAYHEEGRHRRLYRPSHATGTCGRPLPGLISIWEGIIPQSGLG